MGMGSEWRDLRPVLWDQAFRQRDVVSALALARKLAKQRRRAEAAKAEDAAFELHGAEYRRLCEVNQVKLDAAEIIAGRRSKRRRG